MTTPHHSKFGSKIGPRIAVLVSQSIVHTHRKLLTLKHNLAMSIFRAISDEISEEVDVTLGPFLKMLHDQIPEDHPAFPSINFLHTNHGQLKAIVGSGLQQSGLLGSIATIVNNSVAPYVYNAIKDVPALLPDQGIIAQSNSMGLTSAAEAQAGIQALGIQSGWAERMLAMAWTYPAATDLIEMYRRHELDDAGFRQGLTNLGIPPLYHDKFLSFTGTPLSAADLALAVLRGNMQESDAVSQAFESGVSPDQFKILIGNTGEPPGLMQLLEAFRRGFIDQPTLEKGIRDSRYRDEWIPMLEKLRYTPMSVADAVNATVQNQMPADQARKIADENGLEPGAFDTILNTAGEPLSRTEMEALYNRGLASKDQVIQALRESRLKNKYNDQAFELHARVIPEGVITHALRQGAITHDDAVRHIMEEGYSKSDAEIIVNAGSAARLRTYKDRVVASAQTLYEDNIISPEMAQSVTKAMGFTDEEATFVLRSSELRREAKILNSVVSAIRSKYLEHHITDKTASNMLDALGIPAKQRDYLIKIWTIEHGAYVKTLTVAQVHRAFKLGLITADDANARILAMGYNDVDAALLVAGA